MSKSGRPARRVIVIGAGVAGIAAARELMALGHEVTVLEARDRIGGRVHTVHDWADTPLDLGASWIHGISGNPLTPLAEQAGAATSATSYDSSTTYVSPKLALRELDTSRWRNLVRKAVGDAAEKNSGQSIEQAVMAALAGSRLSEAERADLAYYLSSSYEQEWGADSDELSASIMDEGPGFPGGDVLFPEGYAGLLDFLAAGLPIRTGVSVSSITRRANEVRIQTSAGLMISEAVIVTVPLGVLKQNRIGFDPPLPEEHRHAIDILEVGVLSKTFLRFESLFWDSSIDWLEFVDTEPGRWSAWLNLAKADSNVLLGFNAGRRARTIEAADDATIVGDALAVLRDMFGAAVPEPTATITSRWSRDPWAEGSYSYDSIGSTYEDRTRLAAPIEDQIFFAGEATEADHHSTVHGAYLSGINAARQLGGLCFRD